MRFALALSVALAVAAAPARPAAAQQTVYTDRAAFLSALAPTPTTLTFDGITGGTENVPATIAGIGLDSPTNASLQVVGYANPYIMLSTWPNLVVHDVGYGASVRATFAGTTTAFGLAYGYGYQMDVPQQATLTLWNGGSAIFSQLLTAPAATYAGRFVGVTSATPFTAATVSARSDFLVDDVTVGRVAATSTVPEPETPALLAVGLAVTGLGAARRRARG